jgi:hypothetical protein
MQKDKFDRILSFLLGASWAIVIFGALITFNLLSFLGFSLSLFITIMFIVISFFKPTLQSTFIGGSFGLFKAVCTTNNFRFGSFS